MTSSNDTATEKQIAYRAQLIDGMLNRCTLDQSFVNYGRDARRAYLAVAIALDLSTPASKADASAQIDYLTDGPTNKFPRNYSPAAKAIHTARAERNAELLRRLEATERGWVQREADPTGYYAEGKITADSLRASLMELIA